MKDDSHPLQEPGMMLVGLPKVDLGLNRQCLPKGRSKFLTAGGKDERDSNKEILTKN